MAAGFRRHTGCWNDGMRCWACYRPIHLDDEVNELPILRVLVHRACYERETGQEPPERMTLSQCLFRGGYRAA